ncbi:MAG TPA: cache domain-containing protein, partial [Bauldia sp.]|nr:cache domain-containing protein [Bauldia sp.]
MLGSQELGKLNGIRSRLILLSLIGVLPFVWYRFADIQNSHEAAIAALRDQAIHAAASAAAQQSEVFAEVKTLLGVIARVPAATSASREECSAFLNSVKEGRYWAKSLFVTDSGGEIVCSTDPSAIGIKVGDRPYFIEARDTRRFAVSDFVVSRLDGHPIIVNAFPTYGPDGKLKAMIAATINLFTFNLAVADVGKRLGAQVLVSDANGEVLALFPTDAAAPKAVAEANRATVIDANGVGWFEARGGDGVRRLYGVSVLPGTHARLATGFSIEGELAAVN